MTAADINAPSMAAMRAVLGHFCTGVVVITGHDGVRPVGFTCQSLTSVSLDPPYVSFCPAHTSTTWPAIRSAGTLCINILADDQVEVCRRFAASGGDKFVDISWRRGENDAPALDGVLAIIEARPESEYVAGDHTIVVARVTGVHAREGRRPLLFYRGEFGGLACP